MKTDDWASGKPVLAFFRTPIPGLPHFIRQHLDEHVRCLEHHFDVVLLSGDCDYQEVCETHRPELALFESGVYAGRSRIANTSACPEIPKVGFCNSDAYCATRSLFLSDMDRWGVETFFTLSVAMAEHTPDLADRLFVWPNFVDGQLYRDYGLPKSIPVLFTGSQAPHYPWRSRVHSLVTQQLPCLTTPHAGWFDGKAASHMLYGEGYARLVNAASAAPTCGAIGRDVIRKHFEIPGARTLLVTERTASIEAAGFVDMENVVFAEPGDVLDKLDHLFSHPEELRRITDAGHELVHARHTMAQRDQLLQWLRLHQAAKPGERIVQPGPFERLELVPASSGAVNAHPISGGLARALLQDAERALEQGRLGRAEELFQRCLNYHFMPEPVLGLARCHLLGGDAAAARSRVSEAIERCLVLHSAEDPDPVEWAYLVRTLLCQGDLAEAIRRAGQFPALAHPELDRIRRVLARLEGRPAPSGDGRRRRRSVHVLPPRTDAAWTTDLCGMLAACGQDALAGAVASGARLPAPVAESRPPTGGVLPLAPRSRRAELEAALKRELKARWKPLSARTPHAVVRSVVEKEDVESALLVGASATSRCTRAVLGGLRTNAAAPAIFWLRDATPARLPGRGRRPGVRLHGRGALARVRRERSRDFDVVVIGERALIGGEEQAALAGARFVVLTGINRSATQRLHARLAEDGGYALVSHHATHDGGYSMFRRVERDRPASPAARAA